MRDGQAKAILLCGMVCSGKSTYARRLKRERGGMIFSCDELMLRLFDEYLGERYEQVFANTKAYLFDQALQALEAGIDAILDFGFWTKADRREARAFFEERGWPAELHCTQISMEQWRAAVQARNAQIQAGRVRAYYMDENMMRSFPARYEPPGPRERVERTIPFVP